MLKKDEVVCLLHRAKVDDTVDVRPFRSEPADRGLRRLCEEVCERAQSLSVRVGERVNAPGGIGTGSVTELHRLGVGKPN